MQKFPFSFFASLLIILFLEKIFLDISVFAKESTSYWDIQSVDTMKLSRDLAREKLKDSNFEIVIREQVKKIAEVGATHIALGTPYDEEFLPFLRRWVKEARKNKLNVWFRGNFSGWEGWFGYPRIKAQEHLQKTREFILNNPDLFIEGDIFTACTECENGSLGDPRETKDVSGFREFIVSLNDTASWAFRSIGKNVSTNFFSMNLDVAFLVMDKETTKALGGIVVIDHYVKDPEKLLEDVRKISEKTNSKVVLGEFGAPIPDIHGDMTDLEQSEWVAKALALLSKEEVLLGLNYWVATSGTTSLWNEDGSQRPVVAVLKSYFSPNLLSGRVVDEKGNYLQEAKISVGTKKILSDRQGEFSIPKVPSLTNILVEKEGYELVNIPLNNFSGEIILPKSKKNLFFKIRKYINEIFLRVKNKIGI